FAGYSYGFTPQGTAGAAVPTAWLWIAILAFVGVLTLINYWGIRESAWVNAFCTAVEFGGLAFIIFIGMRYWGSVNYFETPPVAPAATGGLTAAGLSTHLLLQGAVLTFFAFVGFEDI